MICAQCGTEAPAGAAADPKGARCARCRFPLGQKACPECSAGLFGGERFCPRCGTAVGREADPTSARQFKVVTRYLPERSLERILGSDTGHTSERKYATVVFADVGGFTALSESLPPDEIVEVMNGVFDGLVKAVHRYDGTVDKFIGDAVMAVFGAPVTHDNDPERALLAALDMRAYAREYGERVGRQLSVAIGVNAGPLVAGTLGGDGRFNYTVMGDTVNVAQRLQSSAAPNQILVTREIYQRTRTEVRFKPLPPLRVKGKRNPIDVWEAREGRARTDGRGRTERFVGREDERRRLHAALAGPEGRFVAVVGEPGVGRTALLERVATESQSRGRTVVRAACPPYVSDRSAGLLTDTLAQLLKVRIDQGLGALQDAKAKLSEIGLSPAESSLLLASATRDKPDTATLDYGAVLKAKVAAWLRVFGATAKQRPVLVVLEDLHHARAGDRAELGALLGSALPPGLHVACTLRHGAVDLVAGREDLVRLDLSPLPPGEARALVCDLLSLPALDDRTATRIQSVTRGNPRMIRELVDGWIDQGLVFRSHRRWIVSPKVLDADPPTSLEALVSARLDELDEDARRFVQAAAVVGMRFDPEVVRRVAGLQVDVEWAVSQLVDRGILAPDEERSWMLAFRHDSYRETAAGSMVERARRALHLRIAQYLEETSDLRDPRQARAVAEHLADGSDPERAARGLLRGAKRLIEVHQHDGAVELLERLLQVATPKGHRNYDLSRAEAEVDEGLYHLGMLYLQQGRLEEAEDALQWGYARSRHFFHGDFRVWSLLGLSRVCALRGRTAEGRKHLETAAADSEGMRDPALVAVSLLEQGRLLVAARDFEAAAQILGKALEVEQKITPELRANLPVRISRALVLVERGHAFHGKGHAAEAVRAFEEAHGLSLESGDVSARGQAALAIAKLAAERGDEKGAERYVADALKCFRELGDRIGEGRAFHDFALSLLARGDRQRASGAAREAARIFEEVGYREGLVLVNEVRERLGRLKAAGAR